MQQFDLEALAKGIPHLTESFCGFLAECALYCFHSQHHLSGVALSLQTNEGMQQWEVCWTKAVDDLLERTMRDEERTTDFGAMAIALLSAWQIGGFQACEVSRKGTGVDFWLYYKENEHLDLSMADARLEVSGIRRASMTNSAERRLRIKKRQVMQSADSGKTVYISITEFGTPLSIFVTHE